MSTRRRVRMRAPLVLLMVLTVFCAPGCARKPASQSTGPAVVTPGGERPGEAPASGGTPSEAGQRPAPYGGRGLPDPYINGQGELELIFADARGTVKPAGNGRVTSQCLSPDRMKLAYTVLEGTDERVYIVDASLDPWRVTRTDIHESPLGVLAFSPCGEYLTVDSGTSVVRALFIVRVADGEVIGGASVFIWAVWSPGTPSRLAVALLTERPLVPATELDVTVDAAVIDLPSGLITRLKRGTINEFWAPREWDGNGSVKLDHESLYPTEHGTITVAVPPPRTHSPPSGSGPLPQDAQARPEVDASDQLLLTAPDGTVLRQLTDKTDGWVVDYASSDDGQLIAYTWQDRNEDHTRLFTVSLPDLAVKEVDIGPHMSGLTGYGPRALAFAPGKEPFLLALWGFRTARIYDLGRGTTQDVLGANPIWAPEGAGDGPRLVFGFDPAENPSEWAGMEGGLFMLRAATGTKTALSESDGRTSFYPLHFVDEGTVLAVKRTVPGVEAVVEVRLPE